MTWTYSGDPATNTRDAVRWLVGDTDTTDQLVSDEEITYALAQHGSTDVAAAIVCEAIAARFARQADKTVGDLRITLSQKAAAYQARAAELRKQGLLYAVPTAGGISIAGKEQLESDADRPAPFFRRGLHDNPSTTATGQA